ncbi:MAG: hypothetical protein RL095_1940 [Verrucomicrobiota bacterium]|jgi:hypothetical protein
MSPFLRLAAATAPMQAELLAIPFVQDGIAGRWSREEYLAFLTQAYHHVKHTTPLLMACGSRIPESHEWLRDAMAEYIEEEVGHQRWILEDIRNCGGDVAAAIAQGPSFANEMMISYAYDIIQRQRPCGFLGMVNVLEGTSVRAATQAAENLGRQLGLGKNCFSYLSSHGSLDLKHIDFFASLVERLDSESDLEFVIHCSKNFFRLYGDIFREHQARFRG